MAVPFHEPYVTSVGTLTERQMVLLRLEADGGLEGWGDAVPLTLRGGEPLEAVRDALDDRCAAALAGSELDRDALLDACEKRALPAPALAAVDTALLDLVGKLEGEPAWRVLRAESAAAVTCNGTLGAGDPAEVAAIAATLAEAGFGTLKLKVGTGDDLTRFMAVRGAAGEEVRIRIDANGAWSVSEAIELLMEMSELGLELAEQPCATSEEMAVLGARIDVPIIADENVASLADAARVSHLGACDGATLKLAKVGGAREALRIAAELPSYMSSALDSPLGIAAAVHAVQALPEGGFASGLAHGLATSGLFADNVAPSDTMRGPVIEAPAGPGLGVEIDREAVERLQIR